MSRNDQQWDNCPAGQLGGMVESIRFQKRQQRQVRMTAVGAAVVLTAIAVGVTFAFTTGENKSELKCEQVVELLGEYEQASLSRDMMQRVALHLKNCLNCERERQRLLEQSPGPTSKHGRVNAISLLGDSQFGSR